MFSTVATEFLVIFLRDDSLNLSRRIECILQDVFVDARVPFAGKTRVLRGAERVLERGSVVEDFGWIRGTYLTEVENSQPAEE